MNLTRRMPLRDWFRPPRHLLALFWLVTVVPSALLVVLGWRSLAQERIRTLQDNREQAADLAVSGLQLSLSAAERQLTDGAGPVSTLEDSAVVTFDGKRASGKLLFYPFTAAGEQADDSLFGQGEELEFQARDYPKASTFFSGLAASSDPPVRAGALIRAARNFEKAGNKGAAIAMYGRAAQERGVSVAGVPADLFARWAECDLLSGEALHREAEALRRDLLDGRWQLDRNTFELHVEDANRWVGETAAPAPAEVALAEGAGRVWREWQNSGRVSARESMRLEGRELTVLWTGDAKHISVLIAGPEFVRRNWIAKLGPMLARQHATLALREPGAHANAAEARRPTFDTGLPWTIAVESTLPAGFSRMWISGLALLAVVAIAGTYLIARAVARELAVARLQSDFVSAVSHEFRTPLTSLRQLTEILADGRVAAEDRRHTYYEAMMRQTERLHQLVEGLLDFGRMEAGRAPYHLEPLDACALVRTVVERFDREAQGRGYHVELEVNGTAARVDGDPEALTNALWNLLDNAVKYSLDCRTVWVAVERTDRRLAIRVRDQGLGIPRAEQKEIFRRFVRGAAAKASNIRGTGIGLAMVDHIVKAHGGEVRLKSEPGSGSTFTLWLPCHES